MYIQNSIKNNFFVKNLMMIKKSLKAIFLVSSLFCFFASNAHAQVDSAKAVKLKAQLIDTICTCVSQVDTSTVKTAEDAQGVLMKCFMGNGMSLFMEYSTASGVEISDMSGMQNLVTKLGMELSLSCPAMIKLAMKIAQSSDEYKQMMQPSTPANKSDQHL